MYDHNATQYPVACFKSAIKPYQEDNFEAADSSYWYRAMTKQEYQHLKRYDLLNINFNDLNEEKEDKRYIGIGPNHKYSLGFMGNKKAHTHLVEFKFWNNIKFFNEMKKIGEKLKKENEQPKAEGAELLDWDKRGITTERPASALTNF